MASADELHCIERYGHISHSVAWQTQFCKAQLKEQEEKMGRQQGLDQACKGHLTDKNEIRAMRLAP